MKIARFLIDSHVQRHAAGPEFKKLGLDDPKKIKWAKVNLLKDMIKDLEKSIEEDEEMNLKNTKGGDKSKKRESYFSTIHNI